MAVKHRKSVMSGFRNGAHERVDAVADSIDSLRDRATEYIDEGRSRAGDLADTFEDTIHERPLIALVAAGAVGFILGCYFSRR